MQDKAKEAEKAPQRKKTLQRNNVCLVKTSQKRPPKKSVMITKINTKLSLLKMCQARETLAR